MCKRRLRFANNTHVSSSSLLSLLKWGNIGLVRLDWFILWKSYETPSTKAVERSAVSQTRYFFNKILSMSKYRFNFCKWFRYFLAIKRPLLPHRGPSCKAVEPAALVAPPQGVLPLRDRPGAPVRPPHRHHRAPGPRLRAEALNPVSERHQGSHFDLRVGPLYSNRLPAPSCLRRFIPSWVWTSGKTIISKILLQSLDYSSSCLGLVVTLLSNLIRFWPRQNNFQSNTVLDIILEILKPSEESKFW